MAYIFYNTTAKGVWMGIIGLTTGVTANEVRANNSLAKEVIADFRLATEGSTDRIKPTFLDINLLADELNDFSDLYTENEREVEFLLLLGNDVVFQGWINPDGIFQNQVDIKWYITLRATDGLDALQNLAYVAANGNRFTGYATADRIIGRALLRLGTNFLHFNKAFNGDNATFYLNYRDAVTGELQSFLEVQFNQDVFFDGEDIQDCASVITEVLNMCNCVLFQHAGRWVVVHEYDYHSKALQQELPFFFGVLDTGISAVEARYDFDFSIGPHSLDYQYYWVNTNQRITTLPSIGAVRFAFDFGEFAPVGVNPNLENDGALIEGHQLLAAFDERFFLNDNSGVTLGYLGNRTNTYKNYFESNPIPVDFNEGFTVSIDWFHLGVFQDSNSVASGINAPAIIYVQIIHSTAAGVLSYFNGAEWIEEGTGGFNFTDSFPHISFSVDTSGVSVASSIEGILAPEDGEIKVRFFRIRTSATGTGVGNPMGGVQVTLLTAINRLAIEFTAEDDGSLGIEHTVQQENRLTSVIKETVNVLFSNSEEGQLSYAGTLLNAANQDLIGLFTVTSDVNNRRSLLRLLTEEVVREQRTPRRQYSGDVRGFVPRIARIQIHGLANFYKVVSMNYQSDRDITSLVLEEVMQQQNAEEGLRYSRQLNYGNTIQPTIV